MSQPRPIIFTPLGAGETYSSLDQLPALLTVLEGGIEFNLRLSVDMLLTLD